MVGTAIRATPDAARASAFHNGADRLGVALYHAGSRDLPGLGANLRDQVRRGLPRPPSQLAWDFLSIAMSIFAADRFVLRSASEDGWTRVSSVDVAVQNPAIWDPQRERLAAAFRFLTGDIWHLSFSPDGDEAPAFPAQLTDRDCICLFSGGLDSLLGAIKLQAEGRTPLLVSQGSPKEISPQVALSEAIGLAQHRFEGRVSEKWRVPYEGSTRGRSLIFFAYGVLAASALELGEVIVPENGFIAINPPLTRRRLGSLSTRTTHPHLLKELSEILDAVGIRVCLHNIFEGKTKGEMLAECSHPQLGLLASRSYSCGKGKRLNKQCGRCIPCLIRRASFHASGVADMTEQGYAARLDRSKDNDDVLSALLAGAQRGRLDQAAVERWVAAAGPLPSDPQRRATIIGAVDRGLAEVSAFLETVRWR